MDEWIYVTFFKLFLCTCQIIVAASLYEVLRLSLSIRCYSLDIPHHRTACVASENKFHTGWCVFLNAGCGGDTVELKKYTPTNVYQAVLRPQGSRQ